MTRLPSAIGLALLLVLGGCTAQEPAAPAAQSPVAAQTMPSVYDQDGALAVALRGRQDPETAYVAIFLDKDAAGTCKAKTVPDTLKIPNPGSTGPKKLRVEWEVLNLCWSAGGPNHEVSLLIDNDPTTPLKNVAEFPNSSPNAPGFENRDTIRKKVKLSATQGRYAYKIMLKIGAAAPVEVLDPEIEIEGI